MRKQKKRNAKSASSSGIEKRVSAFLKDRHNFFALLIFVFALAIRMNYAFVSGMWVDEGRYAVIGRALLEHPFDYSSKMHGTVTIFPPVLPYMLFFSQAIFGAGDFAVRIVNPILSAIAVLVVYALGRSMFNKDVGLIAAALFSVSPQIWFFAERVLLETPSVLFSLLTLFTFYYGYERKNNKVLYASGVFFVLGFLSKQTTGLILPAMGLYLIAAKRFAWLKEKRLWIAALVVLIVMLPWAARSYGACGSISCEGGQSLKSALFRAGLDVDIVEDPYYYVKLTPFMLTTPVLILFFFGLIPLINGKFKKEYVLLLSTAAITYIVFAFFAVKVPRYVIVAIPMILLVAANGVYEISRQLSGKQVKYMPLIMLVILLPTMYFSYTAGKERILSLAPGFLMLKDAGLYLEGAPDGTVIMAAPSQPISFYAGDRKMSAYPENEEDLAETIYNTSTDYVVIDVYERTQKPWILGYVPNQPYLILEQTFQQDGQPVVAVFRVDEEKLLEALNNGASLQEQSV